MLRQKNKKEQKPQRKTYLVKMMPDKKVQFVCFETTLDKQQFIKRWESYTRSLNSDADVTLQQSEKDGIFRYIAQHRLVDGELQFIFSKEGRTSRIAQERIKTKQIGGYAIMHEERPERAIGNESKIFIFITDQKTNLGPYKKLSCPFKLNIYEAYYENCKYSCILEYFVKTKQVASLLEELQQFDPNEMGIYKECLLVKNTHDNEKDHFYVWPS